jgi:hypothetical protein
MSAMATAFFIVTVSILTIAFVFNIISVRVLKDDMHNMHSDLKIHLLRIIKQCNNIAKISKSSEKIFTGTEDLEIFTEPLTGKELKMISSSLVKLYREEPRSNVKIDIMALITKIKSLSNNSIEET